MGQPEGGSGAVLKRWSLTRVFQVPGSTFHEKKKGVLPRFQSGLRISFSVGPGGEVVTNLLWAHSVRPYITILDLA